MRAAFSKVRGPDHATTDPAHGQQDDSSKEAARVSASGLSCSKLGYPARGPARWRRRSESSIITDSAGAWFHRRSPSSRVRCNNSRPWLRSTRNKARKRRTTNLMPPPTAIVIQPAFRFPDCLPTFSAALPFSAAGRSAWTDRRKASIRFTTVADEPPSGPPPASLPLRLSGGWFGGHLIHPIDFAEFIQKLWIAIVQTDDLCQTGSGTLIRVLRLRPKF